MPIGLPGEDGFLRAMILTSNFTVDEKLERLVYVGKARHIFESERSVREVFRHNIRLTIGTGINVLLFRHFRESLKGPLNLADYIRERNKQNPDWINELIAEKLRRGKYFMMDPGFILRRWRWFSSLSMYDKMRKAPVVLMGFIFDLFLFFAANRLMRRGAGAGFW